MFKKSLFLLFMLFLFAGADRFSLLIENIHIRFVLFLALFSFFYFYYKAKIFVIKIPNYLLFMIFIISSIISLSYNFNIKSVIFELYLIFTYIFIYWLVINISKLFKTAVVLEYYLMSMKIIAIYTIFQFTLGQFGIAEPIFAKYYQWGITRPAVWFYEPSYLALTLIIYFSITYYLFINRRYIGIRSDIRCHLFISVLAVIASTSSTAYLGLFLSILIIVFFSRSNNIFRKLLSILAIAFVLMMVFLILNNLSNNFIEYQLFRLNISSLEELNGISGGRVEGWFDLIDVIKNHLFFGIGGGNYYVLKGVVATNVTLELIAEYGLIGFIIFLIFINYPIFYYIFNKKRFFLEEQIYINSLLFSLLIALIIWQANQNYMRIYMWIHYALIYSFIFYNQERRMKNEYTN